MKNRSHSKGFSLVEVSIALIVLGLIAVPLMQIYENYTANKVLAETDNYAITVQLALQKYAIENGRYPRPAVRNLPPTNAMSGMEAAAPPINPTWANYPVCSLAGTSTFVCRARPSVPALRDTAADADILPDHVLIGDVPHSTIGLPPKYARDGYGNKFTYAVTASMTEAATFAEDRGAIRVIDNAGVDTVGTAGNVHFVVISHGEDRRAAFSVQGVQILGCAAGPADRDDNNCNGDGTFNNNYMTVGVPPDTEYVRQQFTPTGGNHYDDYLKHTTTLTGDIWAPTVNNLNMYSRNAGNIKIGPGPGVPAALVHVYGNVLATELQTNRICAGANCPAQGSPAGLATSVSPAGVTLLPNVFTPAVMGGQHNPANADIDGGGVSCGIEVMTGVSAADEVCSFNNLPLSLGACGPGTWPVGTNAAGQLICM